MDEKEGLEHIQKFSHPRKEKSVQHGAGAVVQEGADLLALEDNAGNILVERPFVAMKGPAEAIS